MGPNVLIVLCDQLARQHVGAYGSSVARTPSIDRLAGEGLVLEQAYVALPQCSPARASLLTGRYAHQHSMLAVPRADRSDELLGGATQRALLPESVPSLGQAFKRAGYRLGYAGVWHMGGDESARHGFTDYWRTYRYWPDGRDHYVQHLESLGLDGTFHEEHRRYGFARATATGVAPSGPSRLPREHTRTAWTVDRALEFLAGDDGRPWLLCASIKDPHPPVVAPEPFASLVDPASVTLPATLADDLAGAPDALARSIGRWWTRGMREPDWRRLIAHYLGLVAHVDAEVGRLLAALDDADDTIVVLTSDHGEMLGAHHLLGKGPSMFDESIGVPFVVRWPGRIAAGRRTDALFSTVDVVATLGGLCGVDVDAGEGLDFAPVLLAGAPGPRSEVFSEFYVTAEARDDLTFVKTVRTRRWKLNLWLYERSELYDLEADPQERRNLIGSSEHGDVRVALAERILAWLRETGDPLTPVVERAARRITA